MLKTEIGREQLDFVSDNLSANFNACSRIFIFLSSISKSPHPPTHPRRNIFEKTSSDASFTLDKSESYFQDSLLIFILECGLIFIRHNGHIQIGREQVVSEHFLSDGGQGFPF